MESVELLKLLEKLDSIQKDLEYIKLPLPAEKPQYNELYAALAKAKLEYKNVRFNRENSFNKQVYADLDAIQKATNTALANQGIVFIQHPIESDGITYLSSILAHSSGQSIDCKNRLIIPGYTGAKSDLQRFGEALAYLKRQVAQAMLGIVANNDPEDNDDADAASTQYTNEVRRSIAGDSKPAHVDQGVFSERISADDLEDLYYELQEYPIMTQSLLKGLEIKELADMPKAKFRAQIDLVRKQKIMLRDKPKKEW